MVKTLSTGYHDNRLILKLLLCQKLIIGPSFMFVPSFMLVSKSARFCHLFRGLKGIQESTQFKMAMVVASRITLAMLDFVSLLSFLIKLNFSAI